MVVKRSFSLFLGFLSLSFTHTDTHAHTHARNHSYAPFHTPHTHTRALSFFLRFAVYSSLPHFLTNNTRSKPPLLTPLARPAPHTRLR